MRVGLLIYGSLDTVSGGYLYDRQLVRHLRAHGDAVEVISLPWRDYGRHLLDNFAADLRGRLRRGGWDVLIQDELNHPSLFLLNQQRRAPYPTVTLVHHLRCSEARPAWQNAGYRLVERAYLNHVDGFIYNSRTTQTVVRGLLTDRRARSAPDVVAYPAADHAAPALAPGVIERRAAEPGPLRVLFLGNVIARKGLHTLLQALARVRGDWRLTVVGALDSAPAYARAMRALAANLRLASRIAWTGRLSDAAAAEQLASHHVLAVPSSYEGFGIVYLEAMAHGLPVLATTAGAAPELITPGQDGALVPPDEAEALAAAMQAYVDDRARVAAHGRAARARYERHPTWAASLAGVRAFLQHQISNARGAAAAGR